MWCGDGPDRDKFYTYEKYRDLFERMLELLLENGIGVGGQYRGDRAMGRRSFIRWEGARKVS